MNKNMQAIVSDDDMAMPGKNRTIAIQTIYKMFQRAMIINVHQRLRADLSIYRDSQYRGMISPFTWATNCIVSVHMLENILGNSVRIEQDKVLGFVDSYFKFTNSWITIIDEYNKRAGHSCAYLSLGGSYYKMDAGENGHVMEIHQMSFNQLRTTIVTFVNGGGAIFKAYTYNLTHMKGAMTVTNMYWNSDVLTLLNNLKDYSGGNFEKQFRAEAVNILIQSYTTDTNGNINGTTSIEEQGQLLLYGHIFDSTYNPFRRNELENIRASNATQPAPFQFLD